MLLQISSSCFFLFFCLLHSVYFFCCCVCLWNVLLFVCLSIWMRLLLKDSKKYLSKQWMFYVQRWRHFCVQCALNFDWQCTIRQKERMCAFIYFFFLYGLTVLVAFNLVSFYQQREPERKKNKDAHTYIYKFSVKNRIRKTTLILIMITDLYQWRSKLCSIRKVAGKEKEVFRISTLVKKYRAYRYIHILVNSNFYVSKTIEARKKKQNFFFHPLP